MSKSPGTKTPLIKPEKEPTPITYKGDKFNPKHHGWRTWGSNPHVILQDSSKEQRDEINKDMVKEFDSWRAARPYLYPRKKNGDQKDSVEEPKENEEVPSCSTQTIEESQSTLSHQLRHQISTHKLVESSAPLVTPEPEFVTPSTPFNTPYSPYNKTPDNSDDTHHEQ